MGSALILAVSVWPASAEEWLAVETDRFTVVSRLDEHDTRLWAGRFDRFLDALRDVSPVDESALPPLTAVLFDRSSAFRPYWPRRGSSSVSVNGVFVSQPHWSVIGMTARGAAFDSTTYHEAAHWFMSAEETRYPRWFQEGVAEVFSTFEIRGRSARFGHPIRDNLETIERYGLRPMEEFLTLVPEGRGVHAGQYYSQAWLFVHYLLIGRLEDGEAAKIGRFLESSRTMDLRNAFDRTFEMNLEQMDGLLRDYARRRRLDTARVPVGAAGDSEWAVGPATEEIVELSLARLAYGARNYALLGSHIERLREIAPVSNDAHDLLMAWRFHTGGF